MKGGYMLELRHKDLEVWKLSMEIVTDIYKMTDEFPKKEVYGITNQLRRAAVSIPSNIAEGASRPSVPDRKRFYQIARSSLVEMDTQLDICQRLGYRRPEGLHALSEKMNHLFAMLCQLIQHTKG